MTKINTMEVNGAHQLFGFHTGLEQLKGESMMTEFSFLGWIPLRNASFTSFTKQSAMLHRWLRSI